MKGRESTHTNCRDKGQTAVGKALKQNEDGHGVPCPDEGMEC